MCIHTCIFTRICIYVPRRIYVYIGAYIPAYLHVYVYMCPVCLEPMARAVGLACSHELCADCSGTYVYVDMYICICICTCICIYIYT